MDPNELNDSAPEDSELAQILERMLKLDETITARAVARKHSSIRQASSFTRNQRRREMIEACKKRQTEFRSFRGYAHTRSRETLASELAAKNGRIAELERKVQAMQVAVLGLIRSVGEMGGISRWLRLFEGYRETQKELAKLDLLPTAEVHDIGEAAHDE